MIYTRYACGQKVIPNNLNDLPIKSLHTQLTMAFERFYLGMALK